MATLARKMCTAGVALLSACIFALLLMVLMSDLAYADITATTGEVHEGDPPASVDWNQHEHDDNTGDPSGAHAFNEEQDYVTKGPIALDVCTSATSAFVTCPTPRTSRTINDASDLSFGTIPANTCIDSHMVHADRPGLGSATSAVIYNGTVQFDSRILGVILTDANLIASDFDPGLAPSVTYGVTPSRGLEFGANADQITIDTTQNRITFQFDVRTTLDQIRVITLGDADSCPGQAKELTLTPKAASNQVDTTHCVTATVKTETGGPARGVVVRFDVEGASEADQNPADEDASKTTNQEGVAEHCYSGPEAVGSDTIHAYADNDRDGVEDVGTDPSDEATKTWLPAEGKRITLEPKADENPVGTEHCVSATVRDAALNPVPDETVRFVVTGTMTLESADKTDESGVAEFCYTGTEVGSDVITAYIDEDNDQTQDTDEPFDIAGKVWQSGQPASLFVDPKAASNEVDTRHCVTATVRDAAQNPVSNVTVRFVVTGVNTKNGSDVTDEGGQAEFCYSGTIVGADAIHAYADNDSDGTQDPNETAQDRATKTWLPAEPAFLTLTPKAAQNPVTNDPDKAHCVQAHVTDAFGNPNPNEPVYFIVTDAVPPGGPAEKQGSDVTDEGGIAEFCYTSTEAGLDAIHAYADSLDPPTGQDGQQDPGEPFDDATKLWHPGDPATLVLTPKESENEVDTQHCVKAEVRDAFGNPTSDEVVRFDIEGASEQDANPADEDGSDTTDEFGNAEFCYTGPDLPGADTIRAYADNDEDNTQDANELAQDTATKAWVFPPSTPGCEVTIHDGGWILTATGSKGTFGGNARIESDGAITRGELSYQDHSTLTPITFHSLEVVAIVCAQDGQGPRADVYGTGRVNGLGPVDFRVRVRDRGEPGSKPAGPDTYQIITAAYTSGPEDNPLQGGNIQIHRF